MNTVLDWLRRNLTDEQLQILYAHVYDKWTWDTNDAEERKILEFLDAERDYRKLSSAVNVSVALGPVNLDTILAGPGVTLTTDGDGTVTISMDKDAPNPPTVSILEGPHGKL